MNSKISTFKNIFSDKTKSEKYFWLMSLLLLGIILFLSSTLYSNLKPEESLVVIEQQAKADSLIHLEVMNGCGVTGVADQFTEFLRSKSFDVIQTGNYFSYDIEKTLIVDRIGNYKHAKLVAEALGLADDVIISQVNRNYYLDVSVIVGKDFNNIKLNQ
ncbi:MAG: LytR C-terminal domain-containing protein [Ignavibacteria bacterium]|nr:LytR C-terminal domain-containing protein [Ignavibacteria bacterium]